MWCKRLARRVMALASMAVAVASCDTTEPGRTASLALQPVFPTASDAVTSNLQLNNLRVVVIRPPEAVIAETVVDVEADASEVEVELRVDLLEETEDLRIRLEARSDELVLFAGEAIVTLTASGEVAVVEIEVLYEGPGSNVAALDITPKNPTVEESEQLQFAVSATDASGQSVAQFFVAWRAEAPATISRSGLFTAPATPTTIQVVVESPNGVTAATLVTVGQSVLPQYALTAGENHNCVLDNSIGVTYCWGENDDGELGDGTSVSRSTVVPVPSSTTFRQVSGGNDFTCAVGADNVTYCWGDGALGKLGNGTSVGSVTPQPISSTEQFASVHAGVDHACARTSAGAAFCWGNNSDGQLGDGTAGGIFQLPTAVTGGLAFQSLAAGLYHTCGLVSDGTAYCWGANFYGQLGNATTGNSATPVQVSTSVQFTAIGTGENFTCGLTGNGDVYCWGNGGRGEMGNGSINFTNPTPVQVTGGSFHALATGARHACAIDESDLVWCWGANDKAALGDDSRIDRAAPVQVTGGITFASVVAGEDHSCGVANSNNLYCWGEADDGQMGDALPFEWLTPASVAGGVQMAQIQAGNDHACAIELLTAAGYCWGGNAFGNLGDGTTEMRLTPTRIPGITSFSTGTAAGPEAANHTCGITLNGAGFCFGLNTSGQLGTGDNTDRLTPTSISTSLTWDDIDGGSDFTCAVDDTPSNQGYCWGANNFGQLGDGTFNPSSTPVAINGGAFSAIGVITAGTGHACATVDGGTPLCWGQNASGQLGTGTAGGNFNTPVSVTGNHTFLWMSAGANHTCGTTDLGQALCWGDNSSGQLGIGGSVPTSRPTPVALTATFALVSAGVDHSCGLTTTGVAYCWGGNDDGQLGDGTRTSTLFPTNPVNLTSAFIWISAGDRFTCGVTESGPGYCWGNNEEGQLGVGIAEFRASPVMVVGLN